MYPTSHHSSHRYKIVMYISTTLFLFATLASSSATVASAGDASKMLRAKVDVDLPKAEMRSLIASKAKSVRTVLQYLKDRHESSRILQEDALHEGDEDFGFDFADVDLGDLAGSFDFCGEDSDMEFMGTTCSCSLQSENKEYSGLMDIIGDFSHVMEHGRECIILLPITHTSSIFEKALVTTLTYMNCCILLFTSLLFLLSRG